MAGRLTGRPLRRVLVVTAVDAERDAIATALDAKPAKVRAAGALRAKRPSGTVHVVTGGVGPAEAAAGTAHALHRLTKDELPLPTLIISAGIGGGFAPVRPVEVVVASSIVFAGLGAETAEAADGFVPISDLGFGRNRYDVEPAVVAALAGPTGAHVGEILTVATVTGSADRADRLSHRHPQARAEAMEGAGVAAVAGRLGIAYAEIRAISNVVGPRDRDAWQIADAVGALASAFEKLTAT